MSPGNGHQDVAEANWIVADGPVHPEGRHPRRPPARPAEAPGARDYLTLGAVTCVTSLFSWFHASPVAASLVAWVSLAEMQLGKALGGTVDATAVGLASMVVVDPSSATLGSVSVLRLAGGSAVMPAACAALFMMLVWVFLFERHPSRASWPRTLAAPAMIGLAGLACALWPVLSETALCGGVLLTVLALRKEPDPPLWLPIRGWDEDWASSPSKGDFRF